MNKIIYQIISKITKMPRVYRLKTVSRVLFKMRSRLSW